MAQCLCLIAMKRKILIIVSERVLLQNERVSECTLECLCAFSLKMSFDFQPFLILQYNYFFLFSFSFTVLR
jgi:hypothetical protein